MAKPTSSDVYLFLEGYGVTNSVITEGWINNRIDNLIIPWIQRKTRLSFISEETKIEYISGTGNNILQLSRAPINELVSLAYLRSADVVSNLVDAVEVDLETGTLIMKGLITEGKRQGIFRKGNKNIKVSYKVGYDDFVDGDEIVDVKEAVICMAAKQVLIFIGARTGGGSLSTEGFSRNFGNRGKYTDIINQLDMNAYSILNNYFKSGVVAP